MFESAAHFSDSHSQRIKRIRPVFGVNVLEKAPGNLQPVIDLRIVHIAAIRVRL
jgi:hypothetical protein